MIATPISVAAHDNRGGEVSRGDKQNYSQRSDDGNRWWKPWHHGDNKPDQPVDPAKCAEWQTRLDEWVANYKNTAAKDIQFGTDYTAMVQAFVTNQGLTVNNYDALLADVEAKRVAATTAVEAMTAPDLNCETDTAATMESGIEHGSIKDAKKAMEEYKQSLKQLTEAVRASYGGNGLL